MKKQIKMFMIILNMLQCIKNVESIALDAIPVEDLLLHIYCVYDSRLFSFYCVHDPE